MPRASRAGSRKEEGGAAGHGQGRVRRRQRDRAEDAGAHAGPQRPAGEAEGHGPGAPHWRPGPLPRELREQRRAVVQLRPRGVDCLDRAHEADRGKPQGDRHHPARYARHRQAAGVPGGREVGSYPVRPNKLRELLKSNTPTLSTHIHSTWPSVVEAIGHTGLYDYVEFVGEYGPFDLHDLDNLARAADIYDMSMQLKVDQEPRGFLASRAIGSGFHSILFARDARKPRGSWSTLSCIDMS